MDFYAAKSADLVVGWKPPPSVSLCMNGTTIPRVKSHVHFGMTITSVSRWNDHFATVLKKAAPAHNLTLTLAYRHEKLSESSSLPLFDHVCSIAMQCGVVHQPGF